MEAATDANGKGDLRLITGGVEIVARFQGETGVEKEELVRVREVPIRSMGRYLAVMHDEEKLVELFCDKPEGWAANLTPSSFTEIIEKGEEINDPLFDAWYQRRQKRIERLNPGFNKKVEDLLLDSAAVKAREALATSGSKSSVSVSPTAAD